MNDEERNRSNPMDYLLKINTLEADIRYLKESIRLQASEYERRLTELNHAHAQATSDRNKYLTAELFYSKLDEITTWRTGIDTWRARIVGIAIGVGAVSGGVAGAVALEAMERVGVGVDAEAARGAGGRAVQRTGAALLAGVVGARHEAQERQHLGDRDGGPHGGEVDGGA
jgi:hypothetical protein